MIKVYFLTKSSSIKKSFEKKLKDECVIFKEKNEHDMESWINEPHVLIIFSNDASLVSKISTINSQKPYILLISENKNLDEAVVLDAGFSDFVYLSSINYTICSLKIKNHLKRNMLSTNSVVSSDQLAEKIKNIENFKIDVNLRNLEINGEKFKLTKIEIKILLLLIANKSPLSRSFLVEKIHKESSKVNIRTIDYHIFQLRTKLGKYKDCVLLVRSVGYAFKEPNSL